MCAFLPMLIGADAQNLNVGNGNVIYSFSAEQSGEMIFSQGKEITIQGKTFSISELSGMDVDETESMADNTVTVTYEGDNAFVRIAGNIARYVDASVTGAGVSIYQSDEVSDDTCGEITYILSGQSSNGYFLIEGSYKSSILLNGLTLTSSTGAAIDIQNGKRTAIRVVEGTVNTLADGSAGSQKAALYCKGHLEFKQKGTLIVTGNKAHAISAKEYIEIKNATINILGAKKDGINCNQYFLMESGNITINGTDDDGIQVSFKDDSNREAEDTGTFTMKGGKINVSASATAAKAIKTDGDFVVTAGEITAVASGAGSWDTTNKKTKASSCISVDGNVNISGGSFSLTATAGGGKGISADGLLKITGGTFDITTTGGMLAYVNGTLYQNYTGNADNLNSDYKSSPKGIKVDGDIVIDSGTFNISTKGAGGEGIESKKTLTINGGTFDIKAYDDGTNSSSTTYINGGNITITTGAGDAIDSNGDIYVNGGHLTIIGASSPEQGFDAGDRYSIYITGGEILAAGGGNSAPSSSASTQAYLILSQSLTSGTTVTISDGSTTLAKFEIPQAYGNTATKAPGNWGWGWGDGPGGGGGGRSLLLSCPALVNGKSYTVTVGTSTTTATARLTGGGSGI